MCTSTSTKSMATHWSFPNPATLTGFSPNFLRQKSPTDSAIASTWEGEPPWQIIKYLAMVPSISLRSAMTILLPYFSCIPSLIVSTNCFAVFIELLLCLFDYKDSAKK